MSDEHQNRPGHDATGWIVLGAILIVAGFVLGANNLGLVPWQLQDAWNVASKARVGIGVLVIGVLLIIWAQSGRRMPTPQRGARLYRSRHDKWLAGVLGGLANYFGIDPTPVRLAFLALLFLFDFGALPIAYIIMAIVVPLEPVGGAPAAAAAPPAPSAWPTTGAQAPAASASDASAPAAAPAAAPAETPAAPDGWDDGATPPPAPPL